MSSGAERRQHKRFPIMKEIAKPVDIFFDPPADVQPVPAVLLDLSAGGMGILTFVPMDPGSRIIAQVKIPGLNLKLFEGNVMWTLTRGSSCRLGISFTKIDKADFEKLSMMAHDYIECEKKIAARQDPGCTNNCRYFDLCGKEQKKP